MTKLFEIKRDMQLSVEDTIPLWTPAGTYEIQLLYGDITKLRHEDKVDIIMVSAFPGDYAHVPGTVLGALYRNCGIDTESLAYSKELDLRRQFFCWISKPLPENYSYGRLLCFERARQFNSSLISQIRDMFRVFVPVFNNRETTVITPLLATGNQGHSRPKVLATMLDCAASWIQAGLPLKCLKIVIYGMDRDPGLSDVFTQAKVKYMAMNQRQELKRKTAVQWDVFITYEPEDKPWATKIESTLKSRKNNLKIFTTHQDIDESKVWQDQIFKLMSASQRIVVVLTPAFIASRDCLEQFNMAMCCGRMRNSNILLPFYILAADSMPVYMSLVQYYDCRIRKENDKIEIKIQEACTLLVDHLHEEKQSVKKGDMSASVLDRKQEVKFDYDIFISYSHRNPKEADEVRKMLSDKNPDLKIFFDREELTVGSMWQKSLYHSLDSAKCIIALMSPFYLSSLVCQEEYNIALLRHLTEPDAILFIPVNIEDLDKIPQGFGELKMLDARGDHFNPSMSAVTDAVIKWLQTGNKTEYHKAQLELTFKEDIFENYRTGHLPDIYDIDKKENTIKRKKPPILLDPNVGQSVALCFAGDKLYCPVMFERIIAASVPTADIHLIWSQNTRSHHDLDSSEQIVVFLSSQFVEAEDCMQNLHMALCRQRSAKGKKILHVVQTEDLPGCSEFVKLLHIGVCFEDKVWSVFENKANPSNYDRGRMRKILTSLRMDISGSFSCSMADFFALTKTVDDVLDAFHSNKDCGDKAEPNLVNVIQLQKHLDGQSEEPTEIKFMEIQEQKEQKDEKHEKKSATPQELNTAKQAHKEEEAMKQSSAQSTANDPATSNTGTAEKNSSVSDIQKEKKPSQVDTSEIISVTPQELKAAKQACKEQEAMTQTATESTANDPATSNSQTAQKNSLGSDIQKQNDQKEENPTQTVAFEKNSAAPQELNAAKQARQEQEAVTESSSQSTANNLATSNTGTARKKSSACDIL